MSIEGLIPRWRKPCDMSMEIDLPNLVFDKLVQNKLEYYQVGSKETFL